MVSYHAKRIVYAICILSSDADLELGASINRGSDSTPLTQLLAGATLDCLNQALVDVMSNGVFPCNTLSMFCHPADVVNSTSLPRVTYIFGIGK